MKLPANVETTLQQLVNQLYDLLPKEARPTSTKSLIAEPQISDDEETQRVQRFYNIASLVLNEVFPGLASIDSKVALKEYLFLKKRSIFEQWFRISMDRIRRMIPEENRTSSTSALIPQDCLEKADIEILFKQLAYNISYLSEIEIPKQKVCKSYKELGWHALNESQRIVDQLKLPVLTYLSSFLAETDKPSKLGEILPNEKLSTDCEIQFFQRLYNLCCLLSHGIFSNLQGKCDSNDTLIEYVVNPMIKKAIQPQLLPFIRTALQSFLDELYSQLPKESRPKVAGKSIDSQRLTKDPFKSDPDLQFIAALYNVACQIKNNILPRLENIDSISWLGLIALGNDLLGEIKPLLANLKPILDQVKVVFIDNLYAKLSENDRPGQCGQLISDGKFRKTQPDTFFIQQCYNLACFIFNHIIPGIEGCLLSVQIPIFLDKEFTNLKKYSAFIVSELTREEGFEIARETAEPFLKRVENFLASIPNAMTSLIFFLSFLIKETVKFSNLSITLHHSINAPLVTGNLSYHAACYVREAMKTLDSLLGQEAENLSVEKQQQCVYLLQWQFSSYTFINSCFGINNNTSPGLKWLLKKLEINSFTQQRYTPFVPKEAQEIKIKLSTLKYSSQILSCEIEMFDELLLGIENYDEMEAELNTIQAMYVDFCEASELFFNHLTLLPKTSIITFVSNYPKFDDYSKNSRDDWEKRGLAFCNRILKKTEQIKQLKENNHYIKTAYETLSASIISPVSDFLKKEMLSFYNIDYHKKIDGLLTQLKKEKFSKPTLDALPHSAELYKKEYAEKIDILQQDFHAKRKELILGLEEKLENQKTHFNEFLEKSLQGKLSALPEEINAKHQALISVFQAIKDDLTEEMYRKILKKTEEWLVTLTMRHFVSEILQTKALNNNELITTWIDVFLHSKISDAFAEKINVLMTPLIQTIENQRLELNATNTKEIDRLNAEIVALTFKIEAYPQTIIAIETLKTEQQKETECLNKTAYEPNKLILALIEKINLQAKRLNFSPISIVNDCRFLEKEVARLSEEMQQKLTLLEEKIVNESVKSTPITASRYFDKRTLEDLKLQIVNAKTIKDFATISLESLQVVKKINDALGSSLIQLVNELSKKTDDWKRFAASNIVAAVLEEVPSTPEKSESLASRPSVIKSTKDVLLALNALLTDLTQMVFQQAETAKKAIIAFEKTQQTQLIAERKKYYGDVSLDAYLDSLKNEKMLKETQLALAQFKVQLNENENNLKEIKKKSCEIPFMNLAFNSRDVLTEAQWSTHRAACKQQLAETRSQLIASSETLSNEKNVLKRLNEEAVKILSKIELLSGHSQPSIQVKALISMQESIQKHLSVLSTEYTAVEKLLAEKSQALEKEKKLLELEDQQANQFARILTEVDTLSESAKQQCQVVQAHQYTQEIVSKPLTGTLANPHYILTEDKFYQDTDTLINGLQNQLKALHSKKIQKDPLSPLETAFNQALEIKIAVAQSAINDLQMNYVARQQAWESFSNENVLLRDSRCLANSPQDIREQLTAYKDRFFDRIQLKDRNFQGVDIKNSRFRSAKITGCDFSGVVLEGVDFSGADLDSCRFENAKFTGVVLDEATRLDWKKYGQKILSDHLIDPHNKVCKDDLSDLIKLVHKKHPDAISGGFILSILEAIGQSEAPESEKANHLIAQKKRALFIVEQLVPQMNSLDEVLKLNALVQDKQLLKDNAKQKESRFGFIRRERDWFRCEYGNTHTWKQIMLCIQDQLNKLADGKVILEEQYKPGKAIMETHVEHDYGFGFFYTPRKAYDWEDKYQLRLKNQYKFQ